MFQKPKSAKKLFFDVIPKTVDEYFNHLNVYSDLEMQKKFDNPIWHIHNGVIPSVNSEITFNSLLNLVSVCNSSEKEVIWGFIKEYDKDINPNENSALDSLIQYSINYYNDFVLPNKKYLKLENENRKIFEDLKLFLETVDHESSAEELQTQIYEIGKKYNFENLRDFFKLIYQVLLGQEQGPRLGSFIKLYGIQKTIKLINDTLSKG